MSKLKGQGTASPSGPGAVKDSLLVTGRHHQLLVGSNPLQGMGSWARNTHVLLPVGWGRWNETHGAAPRGIHWWNSIRDDAPAGKGLFEGNTGRYSLWDGLVKGTPD